MRIYAGGWGDGLMHDARCAFRTMRRFPVATIVAVASLAAGIGATASALAIRNAIFRNPYSKSAVLGSWFCGAGCWFWVLGSGFRTLERRTNNHRTGT
jgi:hypothetical protein